MKTLLFFCANCLFTGPALAQKIKDQQVPAAVRTKFQSLFPTVKNIVWIKSGKGTYEAEFKEGHSSYGATFDSTGNFKEKEMEMKVAALSKEIHDYVAKNYPGFRLTEAAQITYSDGKPMYEAEVTRGKERFDLLFDAAYNFIKKGHF
jgi:hypothetical protein